MGTGRTRPGVRAATAEVDFGRGTIRAVMWILTALLASSSLSTGGTSMAETMALEAPKGIWNENSLRSQPMTIFSGREVESKVRTSVDVGLTFLCPYVDRP